LSANLAAAREEEGRRIARELHDELGGSLSAIKWDLERLAAALGEKSTPDISAIKPRLEIIARHVRDTGETVRRIASELRPAMLDDLGLVDAIEWHAHDFERRTGIPCHVHRAGTVALSPSVTTAIFRIFQEALTNILRHADAGGVDIAVIGSDDGFELTVRDDGAGIAHAEGARSGLGIAGMRERAALIGAALDVISHPGGGTLIRLRVPLTGAGPVTT
jgi:signal transduction histidine kinase